MKRTVVCLPGDGIGPEVMAEAQRALRALGLELELDQRPFGGAAIRSHGDPLPDETLEAARTADAILKAPVGDPEFEAKPVRPELGIMRLRQELDVYANLRPARQDGIDLLIVRELVGGIYYGERGTREDGTVYDTCEYTQAQVERVVRRAFEIAGARSGRVTSVDKANVLDTSRLWRRVASEVASEFPDVELEHLLVDNAAMQLARAPQQFDVLVMENMFGDILSALAAAVTGGLGVAGSASLGDAGPGVFAPVGRSAPRTARRRL